MDYSEKLKDPRWQKRRLEIMQRDDWRCMSCGDGESPLHVHHRRYIKGRDPWAYPESTLVTLCESCHKTETEELQSALHDVAAMFADTFWSFNAAEVAHAVTTAVQDNAIRLPSDAAAGCIVWLFLHAEGREYLEFAREGYFEYLHKENAKRQAEGRE